jgi:hypothetical protein
MSFSSFFSLSGSLASAEDRKERERAREKEEREREKQAEDVRIMHWVE